MNQTIVAIIPARYGSTRLPAKALVDLCGKPMIQHVYERTARARLVRDVIVATDDERIATVVRAFGGEVVMTPSSLRTGSDRIAHAAANLTAADIIVNVQGDEPLIVPEMIDEAIKPLVDDPVICVGTLVKKITSSEELRNPATVKVVLDDAGNAVYFSRSPIPYLRDTIDTEAWHTHHDYYKHIGLYVFRKNSLLTFSSWKESPLEQAEKLEQLRLIEHGVKIRATLTTHDTIPIDTAEDADRVRLLLQQQSREHHHG
jgi:3-deoxy-manno-octulosonate cytidylyltransferase (CMP-KDO synthetase)